MGHYKFLLHYSLADEEAILAALEDAGYERPIVHLLARDKPLPAYLSSTRTLEGIITDTKEGMLLLQRVYLRLLKDDLCDHNAMTLLYIYPYPPDGTPTPIHHASLK